MKPHIFAVLQNVSTHGSVVNSRTAKPIGTGSDPLWGAFRHNWHVRKRALPGPPDMDIPYFL